MISKRNVWVLGGTGFIGQALVTQLRSDPTNRLHLLVHKIVPHRMLEDLNIFTGSISSFDPQWFIKYPPDVIFHLARPAGSYFITRNMAARKAAKANERLIKIIRNLSPNPMVVYVSGSLMYGSQEPGSFAFENTALNPCSYAKHYIAGEKPWINAQKEGLLDVRFARPSWILGPASWFREFYWNYYSQTGKIPCFGDGVQMMSLVHLDDCARMINQLSLAGNRGQNLNIFSGDPIRQSVFSNAIAGKLNTCTQQISKLELQRRFGTTVASALLSSIPLSTSFPDQHKQSGILYPNPDEMIDDALRLLKNE